MEDVDGIDYLGTDEDWDRLSANEDNSYEAIKYSDNLLSPSTINPIHFQLAEHENDPIQSHPSLSHDIVYLY